MGAPLESDGQLYLMRDMPLRGPDEVVEAEGLLCKVKQKGNSPMCTPEEWLKGQIEYRICAVLDNGPLVCWSAGRSPEWWVDAVKLAIDQTKRDEESMGEKN